MMLYRSSIADIAPADRFPRASRLAPCQSLHTGVNMSEAVFRRLPLRKSPKSCDCHTLMGQRMLKIVDSGLDMLGYSCEHRKLRFSGKERTWITLTQHFSVKILPRHSCGPKHSDSAFSLLKNTDSVFPLLKNTDSVFLFLKNTDSVFLFL